MDRVHDLMREATQALADLPDPYSLIVCAGKWCATYTGDGDEIAVLGRYGHPDYVSSLASGVVLAKWRVDHRGVINADVHSQDRWLAALAEIIDEAVA